jgi:heat shock protein HslJ
MVNIAPVKNVNVNVDGNKPAADYKNATYLSDGIEATLKNGLSEVPFIGGASSADTEYFGNEVKGDLNGDGREDVAFILTQRTGGTGTFYFVVAALNTPEGYIGSNGFFLGDRISPQSTVMGKSGIVIVNYADRKPDDAMATEPSVGKSVWLKFDQKTMKFVEVAQNFEGEANPAIMSLTMKAWNWVSLTDAAGNVTKPRTEGRFILTFKDNKNFSARTDCNGVGGEYVATGNKITFEKMMSTLMYCEGSQEQVFSGMIGAAQSYKFTSKGELVFNLKDGGTGVFK